MNNDINKLMEQSFNSEINSRGIINLLFLLSSQKTTGTFLCKVEKIRFNLTGLKYYPMNFLQL